MLLFTAPTTTVIIDIDTVATNLFQDSVTGDSVDDSVLSLSRRNDHLTVALLGVSSVRSVVENPLRKPLPRVLVFHVLSEDGTVPITDERDVDSADVNGIPADLKPRPQTLWLIVEHVL
ncbi:hypothetical protein GMORB2_4147 [Geosmithia morbida]|uniref:Uncharacterized protein n=1 Tax=Geosmithia morbida TaxID=1094350 RepID=A0A9P4YZC0_9HYPO|nr:uncharacterized protein GMORB2_4147 [Geosmithia morbida]KAF4125307.1 hypothetical protein GMORB2_4147 [Geosmithia morbida]